METQLTHQEAYPSTTDPQSCGNIRVRLPWGSCSKPGLVHPCHFMKASQGDARFGIFREPIRSSSASLPMVTARPICLKACLPAHLQPPFPLHEQNQVKSLLSGQHLQSPDQGCLQSASLWVEKEATLTVGRSSFSPTRQSPILYPLQHGRRT